MKCQWQQTGPGCQISLALNACSMYHQAFGAPLSQAWPSPLAPCAHQNSGVFLSSLANDA
eukprot:scaffold33200_cov13-Tisochrysis_lutea.AAC.2